MKTNRLLLAAVLGLLVLGGFYLPQSEESPAFPGLVGPSEPTTLSSSVPAATASARYANASADSLAILIKDEATSWLGLAHGLKSIGVPFRIVTDAQTALQHDVVLVYPTLTGANTSPEILQQFAAHVRNGKTLIAFSVIGGGMPDLFGFEQSSERANLVSLRFNELDFTRSIISDESEAWLSLKPLKGPGDGLGGVGYHGLKHPPIASFSDGTAAISYNFYEAGGRTGHAYAIGLDFGHYILRAHNGRFSSFASTYVNAYQPKIDMLLRFLQLVYHQGEDNAVSLYPTAFNKQFTALVTHDVDYTQSINNAILYADYEEEQDIAATYFIQTKYVTDYNDSLFFDEGKIGLLQLLRDRGMEIGSHSVAHSNEFRSMPQGTGAETYPSYRPFVKDFSTVLNASISGELRISKFLLESATNIPVVSFRPGHLSLPSSLPQMLEATGYQFSSSITANEALTHLPYRMNYERGYDTELGVFEFPVTIEDEQGRLGSRLDQAILVADKVGRYGGLVNLLIHTDVLDHKMEFEKGFIEEFKDKAWFTSLESFGNWWAMRDSVSLNIENLSAGQLLLTVDVDGTIDGLTLQVPEQWRYLQGPDNSFQEAARVSLGEFSNSAGILFEISGGL